ncbi:MAG: hypothetical protein WHV66_02710 [Anaerolineales bacterium]
MKAPTYPIDGYLKKLWTSFTTICGALRLFSAQLPALADRLDGQI